MAPEVKEEVCVIKEQGDLGLFADPLSEDDKEKYEADQNKDND